MYRLLYQVYNQSTPFYHVIFVASSAGFGSLKSHSYPIMQSVSKENFKIRRDVLTLKCNCNSVKIHGALWNNASRPFVFAYAYPTLCVGELSQSALQENGFVSCIWLVICCVFARQWLLRSVTADLTY